MPCSWVGNRVGQLDPAFVRRFSLVLEVAAPPWTFRPSFASRSLRVNVERGSTDGIGSPLARRRPGLRKGTLRVEFLPLDGQQRFQLFERTAMALDVEVTSDVLGAVNTRLSRLALLTPGDFSSVLRGRRLLGGASVEALLGDLERAHAEKGGSRRLGFGG